MGAVPHNSPVVGTPPSLRSPRPYPALVPPPYPYVDEFRPDTETSDPDGDGLIGVLNEAQAYGTDPYLLDTDGDGVDDGTEVRT